MKEDCEQFFVCVCVFVIDPLSTNTGVAERAESRNHEE